MQSTPTTVPDIIISGFHALSEPLRFKVLQLLKHREICVCDLCDILNVSQSKLSFHLKTLKEANLVCARQEGRWIYYSLNQPQFDVLEQHLAEFSKCNLIIPASCCDESP
ncbi:MAG: metalloregulator ArsR/SmtB family transcription factor [Rivularia sp. ALOHA_DT_140]|nr:metalloregulator ArsR/SmtB family transcription factor [Rivularia sp. ALOHA_DT_140]